MRPRGKKEMIYALCRYALTRTMRARVCRASYIRAQGTSLHIIYKTIRIDIERLLSEKTLWAKRNVSETILLCSLREAVSQRTHRTPRFTTLRSLHHIRKYEHVYIYIYIYVDMYAYVYIRAHVYTLWYVCIYTHILAFFFRRCEYCTSHKNLICTYLHVYLCTLHNLHDATWKSLCRIICVCLHKSYPLLFHAMQIRAKIATFFWARRVNKKPSQKTISKTKILGCVLYYSIVYCVDSQEYMVNTDSNCIFAMWVQ